MIKISEKVNNNEITYLYEVYENAKLQMSEQINFRGCMRKNNGKDYLMIYSPNLQPITDAFSFLNYHMEKQALNSRIKAQQALKLLYSFERIIDKDFEAFNETDLNNLKYFLRGYSPDGSLYTFDLKTTRTSETMNGYIAVYRKYARYLGYNIKALESRSSIKIPIIHPSSELEFATEKYTSSEKVPRKAIEVPWYISIDDFKSIILKIRSNYSLAEELIVRLMFECGLRIGEVLGLTGEDLIVEQVNGEYIPVAYIRNRLTDRNFQKAKTCMKVMSKRSYRTNDYKTNGYGYQKVIVPFELYDLINEYIEDTHLKARDIKPDIYFNHSMADSVTDENEENYYIFLNSQYRPLTSQLWNIRLRKIFKAVGIQVDEEKRVHNLNHRFRHGFAMFHVQHLNYKDLELMERMRHKNVATVAKYFKPTTSDAISLKTDFADNLYSLIPELRMED